MELDEFAAMLRSAPEGHVVRWYSDGMVASQPWEQGWVDVWVEGPDREDLPVWTFVAPDAEDRADDDIVLPPDLVGLCFSPGWPLDYQVVPVRWGEWTDEQVAEIVALQESPGVWTGAPVWSADEVSQAIEGWCLEHVGRLMPVVWAADHGPSPWALRAIAAIEAAKAGQTYLYKPGEREGGEGVSVYVSDQVMDFLLQAELGDS